MSNWRMLLARLIGAIIMLIISSLIIIKIVIYLPTKDLHGYETILYPLIGFTVFNTFVKILEWMVENWYG